jgi:FkbM family methyltransferase
MMDARQDLIYDVGVHNGDDTAYYLSRGYSVVGIEANLAMVEALNARFANELATGALTLLSVGVAETAGSLDFWVCDEHTEWSSFDPNKAALGGKTSRPVKVETRPFASIVAEFGVPHYCKVDIEGSDDLCLTGLTPETRPDYISIELSHRTADSDLKRMTELGYSRFKIIDQSNLVAVTQMSHAITAALPGAIGERVDRLQGRLLGTRKRGDWRFPYGSSGPFGADLPGRWQSLETTFAIWQDIKRADERAASGGFGRWYDIHASL